MSWIRLIYVPEPIKTHIAHVSVAEIIKNDIKIRHEKIPREEIKDKSLRIDPGGMIMMNNQPKTTVINNATIEVKPEHILSATSRWTSYRILDEKLPSGESVYKVYISEYLIAVVPESMYFKIGAWLSKSQGEGFVGRAEIEEALSGHPNILIASPTGNAGDA